MAINLTTAARQVDFTSGDYPEMLKNLQANILASHGRNHARHLFIRFTGDRAAVRNWIKTKVAPDVTSASDQREQSKKRAAAEAANTTFDGGLVTGFFLSAAGYTYLGLDPKRLPSTGFLKGMKNRDKYIGPELALGVHLKLRNRDPAPAQWEAGFQGEIHALLTLADDEVNRDLSRLTNKVQQHQNELNGIGTVTHVQEGRNLRRPIPDSRSGSSRSSISAISTGSASRCSPARSLRIMTRTRAGSRRSPATGTRRRASISSLPKTRSRRRRTPMEASSSIASWSRIMICSTSG